VAGLATTFGSGAMTNSINEISGAEVIFAIGSNTTEQHPLIAHQVIKAVKNGAKLIVADPRKTQIGKLANIYMSSRVGTDVALINGMMNLIIAEGLFDKQFVETRTEGFEELKKAVADYTPQKASQITGVPAEQIIDAARTYAKSKKSSILYCMGVTQHVTGMNGVMSCANLSMLTGNIGKESTGVNPLRGQSNVQGACDMGCLPNVFPGYQAVGNDEIRQKFEKAWGTTLPAKPGLTIVDLVNGAASGKIKAMYIMGENPMMADPDLNHTEKALKNLDFLVVQDIFLTETAKLASVVLPGVSIAEKDGTFSNTERRVQRVRKAINPIGMSKPDWQILTELSAHCGYKMDYASPSEIMTEIAKLTPSYGGISYARLEKGGLSWPCPTPDHPGTAYLHKDKFSRGLGKFMPIQYNPPAEIADSEYPFTLTTGRNAFHYHTGTLTRKAWALDRESPKGYVEISKNDATKLGIRNGAMIKVSSRRGQILINAKIVDNIQEGLVFIPFHFAEAAANRLTSGHIDPVAKIPEYKVCAVKLERN
jgi:formate dehydrogenase alpha subunit